MTLQRFNNGTNEDGTPRYLFVDNTNPVVYTGPHITGTVRLSDGTVYDVNDHVTSVASEEHAGEVSHAVGVRLQNEGHPGHDADDPFVHECTDACGAAKTGRRTSKAGA